MTAAPHRGPILRGANDFRFRTEFLDRPVAEGGAIPGALDILPEPWRPFAYGLQRLGILGGIETDLMRVGGRSLHIYSLSHHLRATDTDGHLPPPFGRGTSADAGEALSKAFGEFFERFGLAVFRRAELIFGAVPDLERAGYRCLDPRRLAGFSPAQMEWFPRRRFEPDALLGWVTGRSVTSERPALLPAQLVFWNYCGACAEPPEPFLRERNTNGAAGFFSLEGAILAGAYELIQRDGFLIHWLNGHPPPRLDVDGLGDGVLEPLLAEARAAGLEVVFLDTTSDLGIPSCVCVTRSRDPALPRAVYGGGAGFDAAAALRQALVESLGVRRWAERQAPAFTLPRPYTPFRTPGIDPVTRVALWSAHTFAEGDIFLTGERCGGRDFVERARRFATPAAELAALADLLRGRGPDYELLYYRSPHPILAVVGYEAVRVIIPALVPLYLREENAPLGAPRLVEVPGRLGFSASEAPPGTPHPFP